MDVSYVRNLVSSVIDELGGDSYHQRINKDAWLITQGSATGFIGLAVNDEEEEDSKIYVRFRIMKVPLPKALPFYRRLLELNHTFLGIASFSVDDENVVWVGAGRRIEDLDRGEVVSLIMFTAIFADHHDDLLLDEFGRQYAIQ